MASAEPQSAISPQRWGQGLCLAGAALGAAGLVGSLAGWEVLRSLLSGFPTMVPNTALSLILLGVAGGLRRGQPATRPAMLLSVSAAMLVLIIAVGTLAEYGLNLQTGLDQFLIRTDGGIYPPGRPSPLAAVALLFLSTALLIFDTRPSRRTRPSEWCLLAAAAIGSTALLGQILGSGPFLSIGGTLVRGVAVPASLAILMISSGLLLERPHTGVMKLVTAPGPGSVLLRRLAPAAVVAPVVFAILSLHLIQFQDRAQTEFVLAALTVASVIASLLLLAITAAYLGRAHQTIARIQAETRDLIDLASDGMQVADSTGRYIDANFAGHSMFGYTREELLGKSIADLVPPEDRPRLEEQRQALLAGAVRINNWNVVCKDGSLQPVEVSAKILPDGRWLSFFRNIADRLRSEKRQQFMLDLGTELPATLDFNEAVSKIAQLCTRDLADICIVDLQQNDETLTRLQISCRNPSDTSLCSCLDPVRFGNGSRAAQIIGRTKPLFHADLSPAILAGWGFHSDQAQAFRNAGFKTALEVPLRARGNAMGRLVLLARGSGQFGAADLAFAEGLGTLAALSLDNKRFYREAREAATAREQILGYVAHDLRNPLHAISINAANLRLGKEVSAKEIGREIEIAARRMNRLIQDLLDITRLEAGHFKLNLARQPVSELLEDVLHSQEGLAEVAHVRILVAPHGFLPDMRADRDRILQVFENLIGNAIKFNKAGGSITLAAEARAKDLVLSVADTGPGIAEQDLPHIFDRFWQASRGKGHGAGLGLAIVKGLIEAHGGRVWVTSRPGEGSTFSFSIPIAPAGEGKAAAIPESAIQTA